MMDSALMHLYCTFERGHATTELDLNNEGKGTHYLRTSDLLPDLNFARFDQKHAGTLPSHPVLKEAEEAVLTIEGFSRSDGSTTVGIPCWGGAGLLNNHVVRVRSRSVAVDNRFAMYSMVSKGNCERLQVLARGAISQSAGHALATLRMTVPPLEEQRRIADLLDDQVTLLDQAIALRQQQRELGQERFISIRRSTLRLLGAWVRNTRAGVRR